MNSFRWWKEERHVQQIALGIDGVSLVSWRKDNCFRYGMKFGEGNSHYHWTQYMIGSLFYWFLLISTGWKPWRQKQRQMTEVCLWMDLCSQLADLLWTLWLRILVHVAEASSNTSEQFSNVIYIWVLCVIIKPLNDLISQEN